MIHGLVKTAELSSSLVNTICFFVIAPCLNVTETIDRTIQSVVSQGSEFKLRYHVQDGGSTDGTLDRLRYWDNRIKQQPEFAHVEFSWASMRDDGMYDALRTGLDSLDISPEDFMTWINGDDVLMADAFAVVAKTAAIDKNVDWIGGAVRVIDMSDKVVFEQANPTPTQVIRAGLCDGKHWRHLQQEGMFFRKSLWFRSKHALSGFRYAGDWRLWQEFSNHADYYQTDKALGAFRSRPGQLSKAFQKEYEAEINNTISEKERTGLYHELSADKKIASKIISFKDAALPEVLEISAKNSFK
jgi:glycosyltransferase involved in cell wall biosynthesis